MTTPVFEFPLEWYQFATTTFTLRAGSQTANRTWLGGKSVYGPHTQYWVAQLTMTPQKDPVRQKIAAFFSRLDGQAGLIRIGDGTRNKPWYDRNIKPTVEMFSDGSSFSDGTGFESGYLPSDVYLAQAASQGDKYLVLGGFPASLADCVTRGDLLQVMPNGIPGDCPNLYEAMVGGATDASGQIGFEVRPRIRMGLAAGDRVSLRRATSVFRLVDDTQGVMQVTRPVVGNIGFSLVEALDRVP